MINWITNIKLHPKLGYFLQLLGRKGVEENKTNTGNREKMKGTVDFKGIVEEQTLIELV